MTIMGRCRCGTCSYEIAVDDLPWIYACHCHICQRWSGSAFSLQVVVGQDQLSATGPVGTLEQGLDLAETQELDAAVLDVNLAGTRAFAIADRLSARSVPWAFLTGYDEWALPAPYRSASIVAKPFHADRVIRVIGALMPDEGRA